MKRLRQWIMAGMSVVMALSTGITSVPFAAADTRPASGTPATVSADPLPTVQIDGVALDQVIVGNKVYVTGSFTAARPAGVPVGGAGSVSRQSLLAYDITTGILDTTFVHSLTGSRNPKETGQSLAVSPNGRYLFVGGDFSQVDGRARSNVAAFDLSVAGGKLLPALAAPNNPVETVAASNTRLFVGGDFSTVGGQSRAKLAAYDITMSGLSLSTTWAPAVRGKMINGVESKSHLGALTYIVANDLVVVGGLFGSIAGTAFYSLGAVSGTTGVPNAAWAKQVVTIPIRPEDVDPTKTRTSITSLTNDGKQVYLTAFTYITPEAKTTPTFEGRAALRATDGGLVWMNDCNGDSYDSVPIGNILYSASHNHKCLSLGGWTNTTPRIYQHAVAETTYATGWNVAANIGEANHQGQRASTQLHWYPRFAVGTYTGQNQAAWTVTGNASYISYGGEFPAVNGVSGQQVKQQGLVRFATASVAPNKVGPAPYGTASAVAALPADSTGRSVVSIAATHDVDNASLTYAVYRQGSATPIKTFSMTSRFWDSPVTTFKDSGLKPGTIGTYHVVVKDAYGNTLTTADASVRKSPIALRYDNSPHVRAVLGAPTAAEVVSGAVRYRTYASGRMYWSETAGVHYIDGALNAKYLAKGGHGNYGAPTTDPLPSNGLYSGGGRYSDFANTTIIESFRGVDSSRRSIITASLIHGGLRNKWIAMGRSANSCGVPVNDESVSPDGIGRYNNMSRASCAIYYTRATGAHYIRGKIAAKWLDMGAGKSYLKYPITDEVSNSIGTRSTFQGGYIQWNRSTGAVTVVRTS